MPRLFLALRAATLALCVAATPALAQDDDDRPARAVPAWARQVQQLVEEEEWDDALRALTALTRTRGNEFFFHYLTAEAAVGKMGEVSDSAAQLRLLRSAHAALVRADRVAPPNARAEVAENLKLMSRVLAARGATTNGPTAGSVAAAAPAPPRAAPNAPPAAAGPAEQPSASGLVNGRPQGLFFMTRFWLATGSLEESVWYFAPDGRFYENLAEGFSPADLAAHAGPKGTYSVAGGELRVRWADNTSGAYPLQASGSGFSWNMGVFTPVRPFRGGASIAGTYGGGVSFRVNAGNAASASSTLELRADGTYTLGGAGSAQSTTDATQLSAVGAGGGAGGTWRVDGYTLALRGQDGSVRRAIAFPYDDASTPAYPDRLFFAGTMYKRQ